MRGSSRIVEAARREKPATEPVASVPVACRSGRGVLSLAAAGVIDASVVAARALSLVRSGVSGAEDTLDVDALSDDVVGVAVSVPASAQVWTSRSALMHRKPRQSWSPRSLLPSGIPSMHGRRPWISKSRWRTMSTVRGQIAFEQEHGDGNLLDR